jgi:hypothetical protein
MAKEDFWQDVWKKVLVTLIAGAIAGLLILIAKPLGVPLWDWMLKWLRAQFVIPGWGLVILLTPLLFILILGFSLWMLLRSIKSDGPSNPTGPFQSQFTELKYYDLIWRWNFRGHEPDSLGVFCPEPGCDMQITKADVSERAGRVTATCRRCRKSRDIPESSFSQARITVSLEIDRLLRTGEWKKFANSSSLPKV